MVAKSLCETCSRNKETIFLTGEQSYCSLVKGIVVCCLKYEPINPNIKVFNPIQGTVKGDEGNLR